MKEPRKLLIAIPAAAVVLCLAVSYMTRGSMQNLPSLGRHGGPSRGVFVDQSSWQTAQALAPLAVSAEEKTLAREAARLADHEVDQAFAMALRQASIQPRALTGKALALEQRVKQLQQTVKSDHALVAALTAKEGKNAGAAGAAAAGAAAPLAPPAAGDDLAVANAQLALDSDNLSDALEDLARATGDQRPRIQQELSWHQAQMKKYDAQSGGEGQIAVLAEAQRGTLYRRIAGWFSQRSRLQLLAQAQRQALQDAAALTAQHDTLEAASSAGEAGAAALTGAARVKALETLASQRQIMSLLDDRIQTQQQLAETYGSWSVQVERQHKIIVHLMFRSFTWIALIVLCAVLAIWSMRNILDQISKNRRQQRTLHAILDLGVQLVALVLILLVVFGAPRQMPTILGLLTAGLTVVFQDFILAFFGWFVLMGKHGIRIGDWVEIDGVGGEVMEIGLFRTVLLETGNWTASGHPTGRRVTFINSFAIRGQYFNFSTAGQWMWDEIQVNLPGGERTRLLIERIRAAAAKATEAGAAAAEEEWQKVTQRNGLLHFSAEPTVDARPAAEGVDIVVRYVTRAGERLEVRNRLYQEIVNLLQAPAEPALSGAAPEKNTATGETLQYPELEVRG